MGIIITVALWIEDGEAVVLGLSEISEEPRPPPLKCEHDANLAADVAQYVRPTPAASVSYVDTCLRFSSSTPAPLHY